MIFQRSLQRELLYTAGAVFLVLLTLMITTMMIRIVGFAAQGQVDPRDVVTLIALTVIGYVGVMVIATLFVSILFVLTRWYRDSEMVVWLASGMSLTALIRPVAMFALPVVIAVAFFSFVAWPWSNAQRAVLRDRFQQRDDVALIAAGQFRESPASHRVFFVDKVSPDSRTVQNVFVTSTENGKINVVVSHDGNVEVHPNGDRFIVLSHGRRYDGEPGQPSFRVMEFQRYGVRVDSAQVVTTQTPGTTSTLELIRHPTRQNLGELAWRSGLPLTAAVLAMLAIPLAYQNPRRSRTLNLVLAVLIYLTYSNLQNLVQAWIEQGKLPFGLGLVVLHAIAALIVVYLFWLRIRNRPVLSLAWLSRRRGG